jgi:hypothetical protein
MTNSSTRLHVTDAAHYLGVSASMLNKLRCSGGGPAYVKLGRRVVYDLNDLDAYVADSRRTSTSEAR